MPLSLDAFGLASDVPLWQVGLLTVLAFAVGLVGGFVGLALGVIRLPFILLLGIAPATAAGTNIAVSATSLFVGAIRHYRDGRVVMRSVVVLGVPGTAGAFAGALGSRAAPDALLLAVIAVIVVWQGVVFVRRTTRHKGAACLLSRRERTVEDPEPLGEVRVTVDKSGNEEPAPTDGASDLSGARLAAGAAAGLTIGVVGGAVGLVLGIVRLPALVRIMRLDPGHAAGSNMFIGFFVGALGWAGHATAGQVDYSLLVPMAAAAMVGTYLGARWTGKVNPDRLLLTMGVVLILVGPLLLVKPLADWAS